MARWICVLVLLLGPALASADVPGAPPAVEPDCPPGTSLEGPYRYWYCAVVECGPGDACRPGWSCQTVRLRIEAGRASACDGRGCDQVRACVRTPPTDTELVDPIDSTPIEPVAPTPVDPAPAPREQTTPTSPPRDEPIEPRSSSAASGCAVAGHPREAPWWMLAAVALGMQARRAARLRARSRR